MQCYQSFMRGYGQLTHAKTKIHFTDSFPAAFRGSKFSYSVYETNDIIEDIFCFWTWWTNLYRS